MESKIKLISAMIIWGSIGVIVKNIDLSSSVIAFVRGIIGVIFLLIVSYFMKNNFSIKQLISNKVLLIASGIALGANWIFLFQAYKNTTIAIATLSYYLAPIIITVLSPIVLKEKLTIVKVICIISALVGLAFVSGVFTTPLQYMDNLTGIMYGIIAAISYASLTLMNKFIKGLTSMESTIMQLGVASIVLFIYILLTHDFINVTIEGKSIVLLIIIGVIHTGLAFWLFFSSIQDLRGQVIAVFSYIDPVTAIVLSTLLLKERVGVGQLLGAFLILGSTFASELFGGCMITKRKSMSIKQN